MQFYADSDADGKIIGFYTDDVHTPEQIPATVIPITTEEWQDCLANPGKNVVDKGSETLVPAPPPTPPTDAQLLQAAKFTKLTDLSAARDSAIVSDFVSSATGTAMTYGYNEIDQKNLRGKATMLSLDSSITSINWKTVSNGMVMHTRDEFIQLLKDGDAHEENAWYHFLELESQVNAATTPADVEAIVW